MKKLSRTTKLISKLNVFLEFALSEEIRIHGGLLEVFGMGILIIGKSKVAWALMLRSHIGYLSSGLQGAFQGCSRDGDATTGHSSPLGCNGRCSSNHSYYCRWPLLGIQACKCRLMSIMLAFNLYGLRTPSKALTRGRCSSTLGACQPSSKTPWKSGSSVR